MTTLQSWITYSKTGTKPHLPRAVYLASDSRITWGSVNNRWEAGRKVFAPNVEPHLFGFCGDVVLPALIIGQVVSAIDAGVLFGPNASADQKHQSILKAVENGISAAISTPTLEFTIHHVHRKESWPDTCFCAWSIVYDPRKRACSSRRENIPITTSVIGSFGSGNNAVRAHNQRWQSSDAAGNSRAIHASFCDSIKSGDDPLSGGAPQLVAMYTKGPPVQIGMFVDHRRFINGLEIGLMPHLKNAEWRDELGQSIDPETGNVQQGRRRYLRPKKLRKNL